MWRTGRIGFVASLLFALALAMPAPAAESRIGQVKTVTGQAFIVRGGERLPAKIGDPVYESDVVETGAQDGAIGITFVDNTVFSTGPDTRLALAQFKFNSQDGKNEMLADLQKGSLSVVSGDVTHSSPGAMKIKTPTAVLGVSGTTFAVKVY